MDFWKSRIEAQNKILANNKLEQANQEAKEAINRILREANENLETISRWRKATPIVGVGLMKRALLLYKPIEPIKGTKRRWKLARIIYWINLVPLFLYLGFVTYSAVHVSVIVFTNPGGTTDALARMWARRDYRGAGFVMAFSLSVMVGATAVYFSQAKSEEYLWRRIKEVEQI